MLQVRETLVVYFKLKRICEGRRVVQNVDGGDGNCTHPCTVPHASKYARARSRYKLPAHGNECTTGCYVDPATRERQSGQVRPNDDSKIRNAEDARDRTRRIRLTQTRLADAWHTFQAL